MDPSTPDHAVAELLNGLNKGQYLILAEAIRQLSGELVLDWATIEAAAARPLRGMHVAATEEGPLVIRLAD
jgi:hypothetical protein